ncbi:hypothetical protein CHLRE_03g163350v5 [Chlamydomonas reinhardtii]|uniref:2-dehydropantoate 2-reductase n=1 Tax=Chlamydomonas reinhardtii TaxID=3055 RepID=A0A2K3DWJ9_CHLRE|nr:uncharacterized protein CHLRE_03g163350v5 [Chlamydomonas reinhardtii]PNW84904.1 hypothetical protein CHLRE_03g163350v5 [Chlamydomonas reinhardtii]
MIPTAPQSWHVLGAGSVGLLFAFYLRKAGHNVTLILRNEAAIQSFNRYSGSRVHLLERWRQPPASTTCGPPTRATAPPARFQASEPLQAVCLPANPQTSCHKTQHTQHQPAQPRAPGSAASLPALQAAAALLKGAPIQHLVLATKAPDAVPALRAVLPHLAPGARCLLLQNGALAVADELRRELGAQLVLPGPAGPGLLPPAAARRPLGGGADGAEGDAGDTAGVVAGGGGSAPRASAAAGVSTTSSNAAAAARGDVRLYVGSVTHGCYRAAPPVHDGPTVGLGGLLVGSMIWMTAIVIVGAATSPATAFVMTLVAYVATMDNPRGVGERARGIVHAGRGAVTLGPLRPLLAALDAPAGLGGGSSGSSSGSSNAPNSSEVCGGAYSTSEVADDAAFIAQLAAAVPELAIRAAAVPPAPPPQGATSASTPPSPAPTTPASATPATEAAVVATATATRDANAAAGVAQQQQQQQQASATAAEAEAEAAAAAQALLRELHLKLAVNAAINPLGALLGARNGQLAAGGASRRLMRAVCGELVAVFGAAAFGLDECAGAGGAAAAAAGGAGAGAGETLAAVRENGEAVAGEEGQRQLVEERQPQRQQPQQQQQQLECNDWAAERLFAKVCAVAEATAGNRCSMLADVEAGRRTEVDYLTGWVLAAAAARGLDPAGVAPTNCTLYELVKAKEEVV